MFDWDLAAAAHAAELALSRSQALNAVPGGWGGLGASPRRRAGAGGPAVDGRRTIQAAAVGKGSSEEEEAEAHQRAAAAAGAAPAPEAAGQAARPKDFRDFMARIGQDFQRAGGQVTAGLQRALDEAQRGLQKVAQVRAAGWRGRARMVSSWPLE
jgi:hypothetical protein